MACLPGLAVRGPPKTQNQALSFAARSAGVDDAQTVAASTAHAKGTATSPTPQLRGRGLGSFAYFLLPSVLTSNLENRMQRSVNFATPCMSQPESRIVTPGFVSSCTRAGELLRCQWREEHRSPDSPPAPADRGSLRSRREFWGIL